MLIHRHLLLEYLTLTETVPKLAKIFKRVIVPKSKEELKKIEFICSQQYAEYVKSKVPENYKIINDL